LEAVVLETLRLLPPAYMVGRCAAQRTSLGGHAIPAGTTVLVAPYIMHRDARFWDRPTEFVPERWLAADGEAGASGAMTALSGMGPNGAYMPFGAGPRNCIGTGEDTRRVTAPPPSGRPGRRRGAQLR
jgi:cytochrome P450